MNRKFQPSETLPADLGHAAKRLRTELTTPAPARYAQRGEEQSSISIVPPSTIKRMLSYMWSNRPTMSQGIIDESTEVDQNLNTTFGSPTRNFPRRDLPSRGTIPRDMVENKLLSRLKEPPLIPPKTASTSPTISEPEQFTPMRQVAGPAVSTPIKRHATPTHADPSHPASPACSPALHIPESMPRPSTLMLTKSRTTVSMSDITSSSSSASTLDPVLPPTPITSSTQTESIYPQLTPSYRQRTDALRELFKEPSVDSSNTSPRPLPIIIPTRPGRVPSPSVKDLVKSFEGEHSFSRSLEKMA